jgi:protein O-GlcNAc transferase
MSADTDLMKSHELHAQALSSLQAGEMEKAEALFAQAAKLSPREAAKIANHGYSLLALERYSEALAQFDRALELKPSWALAHYNRGLALYRLNRLAEAEDALEKTLRYAPDNNDALLNLAHVQLAKGDTEGSIENYEKLLERLPDHADARICLAIAWTSLDIRDQAIKHLNYLEKMPSLPRDIRYDIGQAYRSMAEYHAAGHHAEVLVQQDPNDIEARNMLGNMAFRQRYIAVAEKVVNKTLAMEPDNADALLLKAQTAGVMGNTAECLEASRHLLNVAPNDLRVYLPLLFNLNYMIAEGGDDAQVFVTQFGEAIEKIAGKLPPYKPPSDRNPKRKLRVGLVSSDFYDHSCGLFVESVFRGLDRDQFEVVGIHNLAKVDSRTSLLKRLADKWVRVFQYDDMHKVNILRELELDVAFDLNGHTSHNLLGSFGARIAPVQISWLGYPNTTGIKAMDYRFVDALTDPPGVTDPFYVEELVRLPRCFLCFAPTRAVPPITDKSHHDGIVFGSFNAIAKISPAVMDVWAQIMRQLPNSRLCIKSHQLQDDDLINVIRERLSSNGIPSDRLEIFQPMPLPFDHLSMYNEIDIALDTFPYNGTTTTCEALSMGVPVVAIEGKVHAARVATSLLNAVGLPELVAGSTEEYVRIAVELANDIPRLRALQGDLRKRLEGSELGNVEHFAAAFGNQIRDCWERYCADGVYEADRRLAQKQA